jgi:hypothetical protein
VKGVRNPMDPIIVHWRFPPSIPRRTTLRRA